MTTFTFTVDDQVAAFIRRVATQEKKEETAVAAELLEWATVNRGVSGAEQSGDDTIPLAVRQKQIRLMFERNEW